MDSSVIAALISAGATVSVAVFPRIQAWLPKMSVSVTTLAVGAFITGVIAVVGLASQLGAIDDALVGIGSRLEPIEQRLGTIEEQVDPSSNIGDLATELPLGLAEEADLQARSIIDGNGPDRWPVAGGREIQRGNVLYLRGGDLTDIVYPNNDRGDEGGLCLLEERARLTVRGFSRERNAALVEYTPLSEADSGEEDDDQEDSFFRLCTSGTHFFYPAPSVPNGWWEEH